jgi:hypothetical protein
MGHTMLANPNAGLGNRLLSQLERLQELGMISYVRGHIILRDRKQRSNVSASVIRWSKMSTRGLLP